MPRPAPLALVATLLLPILLLAAPRPAVAGGDDDTPRGGNRLSKRTQLRYEDVLTTRGGSRWRGKLVERGERYVIVLEDGSEVAVEQGEVASITRELQPGLPHTAQWGVRASIGGEVAIVASETNGGTQYGGLAEVALTRNLKGAFEPELILIGTPLGPTDGAYSWQVALGTRFYLNTNRRAKPYTFTNIVVWGEHGDLGIRTGPGLILDVSPNFGLGWAQGVTLMSQSEPKATGVGYHVLFTAQGRF